MSEHKIKYIYFWSRSQFLIDILLKVLFYADVIHACKMKVTRIINSVNYMFVTDVP